MELNESTRSPISSPDSFSRVKSRSPSATLRVASASLLIGPVRLREMKKANQIAPNRMSRVMIRSMMIRLSLIGALSMTSWL